ncbi:MAG: hypothetical protein O2937_02610 [Bacteroidetes bacterium]|nr:hypothetical protein [Bacteroidota bacterium]
MLSTLFLSAQDDLFDAIESSKKTDTSIELLPEKMLFTQRMLWGEKGLLRTTGIAPLTREQRVRELQLRKSMLTVHQVIGYATLAGMVAQGIIGGQLYNGDYSLRQTHKTLGNVVTATYFTGAALSLFTPPPLVSARIEGISGARAHKWLATVHLSAMIATQYYKNRDRDLHKVSAYTAVGAFAAATLVLQLK